MAGSVEYGLDKELRQKQAAKYDVSLEKEVTEWIEALTGEKKGAVEFGDWLKDGRVLCALANSIKPGAVKKVNTSSLAFKQMENISFFLTVARDLGVPESAMFSTPDLYEGKNLGSVVNCLYSFGGALQVSCPDFPGPHLGIALTVESKDKKRASMSAPLTDQSAGFSTSMDVHRPTERADYVVKPGFGAPAKLSPRPMEQTPPRLSPRREAPSSTPAPVEKKGKEPVDGEPVTLQKMMFGDGAAPPAAGSRVPPAAAPSSTPPTAPSATPSTTPAVPAPSSGAAVAVASGNQDGVVYGLDKELKQKQDAKYDMDLEAKVTNWIEAVSGESRGSQTFAAWLKDGHVLCALANSISPGIVQKVNSSSLAFKQMENITFFVNAARQLGVPESATFATPDLFEEKNVFSVVGCVYALGGAVQVSCPNFQGPHLGVAMNAESKDKKRTSMTTPLTDQYAGYSTAMEVERPKAH